MEDRDGDAANEGESLATVEDRITDAVFALDSDWRFTYVDDRAIDLFDLGGRNVITRSIWLILPELAGSRFQDRCLEAMKTDRPVHVEQAFPTIRERFSLRIYPGDDGVTVCACDVPSESTGPADNRQTVAETVTDAVVTIDADNTIRRANSATEDLFGYEPAELVGEPVELLLPDGLTEPHRNVIDRTVEPGKPPADWRDVAFSGERKDGERLDLSVSIGSHSAQGERRLTAVIRDTTEQKRREQAFRAANEVFSEGAGDFEAKTERLLSIAQEAVGTSYATLSEVVGDEYLFDTVIAPSDAELESGDTVPLDTTNCERVVASGETLVLNDIEKQAPALSTRAGNEALGTASYLGAPVLVDGEVTGTFCFYDGEPRSEPFTDWQVTFVEHLAAWVGDELERRRYVERLAALNELNGVVQAVADVVVSQPTRGEIEHRVCEELAAADSYLFAWVGEANPRNQTVESRAEAGVENYSEGISISVDSSDPEGQGPTGRAFRTGEVQTAANVSTDPSYEPWQDSAAEHGYRSSAAIPIEHEGTVYGVLNVYTDRSDAFTEEEYDVVGLLGKIVGHAISSIDRRQVLLADSVVDLDFRVSDAFADIEERLPSGHELRLEAVIPREDSEYIVFGTTDCGGIDLVESLVEHRPNWLELLTVREREDDASFEVLVSDLPLLSAISAAGGRFVETVITEGDLRVRVQLPHDADARELLDAVRDGYGGTKLVSKQQVTAAETETQPSGPVALDELTDRRLEALRTAYHAGYFAWPRETSGEDVATLLDISPPTFSQHLRAAEQSVFRMLFEEAETE